MYRIKVKNNNNSLFCSAYKTFNTSTTTENTNKQIMSNTGYIDSIYIKAADEYTPVIIHLNK
jgi:hypothetical protein